MLNKWVKFLDIKQSVYRVADVTELFEIIIKILPLPCTLHLRFHNNSI